MKTDLFQSCGHCWVFPICWHIECSTFTASSFRIWNSSTAIPSLPLALFRMLHILQHYKQHSCIKYYTLANHSLGYFLTTKTMTSKGSHRTSQWMKVHVPVQGTWVQSLVWEDPTCLGATKRVHHNYWACTLSSNYGACVLHPLMPPRPRVCMVIGP